jgi:hypothetical protein
VVVIAKITAHGEREIARWVKAGGDTLVLTQKPDGKPGRLLRKWTTGVSFTVLMIPIGRSLNGLMVYSDRKITLEQAESFAKLNDYERRGR